MNDVQILNQLLNGNHLSKEELERAIKIHSNITAEISGKIKHNDIHKNLITEFEYNRMGG